MAEEEISRETALDAVLEDNLFGLEIDPCCTQIAAFNLAFAVWRSAGYRQLPQLNLACSGLAIGVTKAEWLKLAEKMVTGIDPAAKRDLLGVEENFLIDGLEARGRNGLEGLYDVFTKAPWLGSLIDPRRAGGDIFSADFAQLEPLLAPILSAARGDEITEMVVAARGMAKSADLLAQHFTLVATNVPYLVRGKQSSEIRITATTFARMAIKILLQYSLIDVRISLNQGGLTQLSPHKIGSSWGVTPGFESACWPGRHLTTLRE
jgi:hypothetical protein